ncbi:hypothetical protein [Sutterella sp.]|uniref:hypothetical protein n=1 Tax=Sutterella sp. TaxID=1981025 RepID=UPI0026E0DDE3|nr:hypothetical protein [Sutterella sp.]MDO5532585.1 hypothetical protein [Sutterella sp.]
MRHFRYIGNHPGMLAEPKLAEAVQAACEAQWDDLKKQRIFVDFESNWPNPGDRGGWLIPRYDIEVVTGDDLVLVSRKELEQALDMVRQIERIAVEGLFYACAVGARRALEQLLGERK